MSVYYLTLSVGLYFGDNVARWSCSGLPWWWHFGFVVQLGLQSHQGSTRKICVSSLKGPFHYRPLPPPAFPRIKSSKRQRNMKIEEDPSHKPPSFYNLSSEGPSPHFCCILLIRNQLALPTSQGNKVYRAWVPRGRNHPGGRTTFRLPAPGASSKEHRKAG